MINRTDRTVLSYRSTQTRAVCPSIMALLEYGKGRWVPVVSRGVKLEMASLSKNWQYAQKIRLYRTENNEILCALHKDVILYTFSKICI